MPNKVRVNAQRAVNGRRNQIEGGAVAVLHLATTGRIIDRRFVLAKRRKEVEALFTVGFINPFVGGNAVLKAQKRYEYQQEKRHSPKYFAK